MPHFTCLFLSIIIIAYTCMEKCFFTCLFLRIIIIAHNCMRIRLLTCLFLSIIIIACTYSCGKGVTADVKPMQTRSLNPRDSSRPKRLSTLGQWSARPECRPGQHRPPRRPRRTLDDSAEAEGSKSRPPGSRGQSDTCRSHSHLRPRRSRTLATGCSAGGP